MASVKATIILRNDTGSNWTLKNPILALGEIGAENDTGLLKLGDGVHNYNDLEYINGGGRGGDGVMVTTVNNKLTVANYGRSYWTYDNESGRDLEVNETDLSKWPSTIELEVKNGVARWVESKITYTPTQGKIEGALITLTRDPIYNNEASTKGYVDYAISQAIVNAPHLKRLVVNELPTSNFQADTIYMVKDTTSSGDDKYKEYLLIGGELVQIGDTSPDLTNYLQRPANYVAGHSLTLNSNGEVVDSGYSAEPPALTVATFSTLGGVKSSNSPNEISVNNQGYMSLNAVATDLLYVPSGSVFIVNGGNATA